MGILGVVVLNDFTLRGAAARMVIWEDNTSASIWLFYKINCLPAIIGREG